MLRLLAIVGLMAVEISRLLNSTTAFALLVFLSPTIVFSQTTPSAPVPQESQPAQTKPTQIDSPAANPAVLKSRLPAPGSIIDPNEEVLHQTPRIMGVLPNFTAVDSNTRLPRLSTREKFVVAMHDSVDYSSFLLVAGLAGKGLSSNAIPSLGKGTAGFGRYYWREFTDQVSGTFFTEAIFPTLTHEDPRYYTLGKNGFFRRAGYAISRTFITKNDRGTNEFNISEIGGNASEAASRTSTTQPPNAASTKPPRTSPPRPSSPPALMSSKSSGPTSAKTFSA
jgi:hypothetical protein